MLGFNNMSTLVGHFVSSPRERKKTDRRDSRGNEREGLERKRRMNESEETEKIKTFPHYPYLLQGQQTLPNCKPISAGCPSEARYTTPLPHPTTPKKSDTAFPTRLLCIQRRLRSACTDVQADLSLCYLPEDIWDNKQCKDSSDCANMQADSSPCLMHLES